MTEGVQGFAGLGDGVRLEVSFIEATDGGTSTGYLYRPAGEPKGVVCFMHPRAQMAQHVLIPALTAAGYAVFAHHSRYVNNDADCLHEWLLLDIAAAMRGLRAAGFERVILAGHSGGASLFSFYQAQAEKAPHQRLTAAPSGDPVALAEEDMPLADAFATVAGHPGEGRFMLNVIDPAALDEGDPRLTDSRWDMYDSANGYRPFPQESRYDSAWVEEFRERQRERSRRLDAIALEYIADGAEARARGEDGRRSRGDVSLGRFMVIYRTLANPAHLDLRIEPSRREIGSIFSPGDPIIGNYHTAGLSRVMTPRGWLSTWSGTSSNAEVPVSVRNVTVPTLFIYPDADQDVFPSEQEEYMAASAASDKMLVPVPWVDHRLNAVGEEGRRLGGGKERVAEVLLGWLRERFE